MPILQDVLAKLKEKNVSTGAPVDLRSITDELIKAGYTDAQIMHAIQNLRDAKIIEVSPGKVILL